jgi:endo-1,4-beta-D-glucanase Y
MTISGQQRAQNSRATTEQTTCIVKRILQQHWLLPVITYAITTFAIGGICPAQQPWPLWDAYTAHFLDKQGRVIDYSRDDLTTSEGESYALFFSLVQNDRVHFDQILHWSEQNLASGDLTARLPGWSWGHAPDGRWGLLDPNSSADADIWIAYSLLEAGRLWHNEHYTTLGNSLAARIVREEITLVPGIGVTLLPGNGGFHPDAKTWIINPSYLAPPLLIRFADVAPASPWGSVLSSLHLQLTHGSSTAFAMDWVTVELNGTQPQFTANSKDHPAVGGSYDAIRVYLWLGIANPSTPELPQLLADVSGMASYLKTHPLPPERVDNNGKVVSTAGPAGFSAALFPYLLACGMKQEAHAQLDRILAARKPMGGLISNGGYYDQNLALFASGWYERRFRFDSKGQLQTSWK